MTHHDQADRDAPRAQPPAPHTDDDQDPPTEDEATPEQPVVQRAGVPLVEPDHDPDDAAEDASPDQASTG